MPAEPLADLSMLEIALLVGEAITIVLGLVISLIAYRGYRRNASKPMFYIAVGFVFVVGLPGVLGSLYLFTNLLPGGPVSITVQGSELVGMISILHAIRTAR